MWDLIIVGAGPAGLSAGLYAARRNIKTLVLSKDLGGQASTTPVIENYPGIMSIGGFELMQKFEEHAKNFGVEIIYEEATEINEKEKSFVVKTVSGSHEAKALILAFGKTPKSLDVPGEREFSGKGISYCATCDAPVFRDRVTAVVGGGNSAFDAAHLLSGIAKKVYLIHHSDQFRAFESMVKRVREKPNVGFLVSTEIKEFKGDKFLKSVVIENAVTKEKRELQIDGCFVEIGSEVKTNLIRHLVKIDESNHIVINERCETYYPNSNKIRPGILAAGDVTIVPFKQAVISAGEGAKAALQTYNYIHGLKPLISADWAALKTEKVKL